MRHVLVDKQGNFGSIAGLPPAAMRYTEARMSPIAALMLEDIKLDTVDFMPTYDERRTEPTVLPSKFPEPAGQRRQRHRGGHGHVDPAAQPGRNLRRADPRDRRPRRLDRRAAGDRARPRFSHRRHRLRPGGHPPRLPHRPQHDRRPRPGAHRGTQQPLPDRHHRDPLPAGPRPHRGTDRRAGERGQDRRHLRHPQRERPEGAGPPGLRAEARRRSRHRAEPALPVLAAAGQLLADLPGAGRRQAAGAVVQGAAAGVHPPPRDGDPPPHAVPAGQGPAAEAHGRRAAAGPRQHRRGDPRDPQLVDPGRGQGAADADPDARRPCCSGRWATKGFAVFAEERGAQRVLHAHARPGRRHPAHDPRPVGQPGAGEAGRRAPQAAGGDHRVSAASSPTGRTSWTSSARTAAS